MTFHKCDVPALDYSRVDNGEIICKVCDWGWILTNTGWRRKNMSMSYD